ncbi:LysE family transporter [Lysinibacillus fusiformis]|uniref:LysE family transporter n=1 Tax=Lysinibacillus fusiformis TaxID=28031 RepID=UPI0018819B14|nr:LysE family transporter [Lysinibacillus fusiformis]MBD8521576.1 LysE family transporter [Lysinibacillus fusiformis]
MLCLLTFQAFRDTFAPKKLDLHGEAIEKTSLWAYFFTGVWLVVSAPTAIVWFATVGGSVACTAVGHSATESLLPFFFGFITVSILWELILSYLSSISGKIMGKRLM